MFKLTAIAAAVSSLALAMPARAQSATAPASSDALTFRPRPLTGADSVDGNLAAAKARPPGILPNGPVSILDGAFEALDEQADKFGLNIGFSFTTVYQDATGGPGQRDAAGFDADLFGDWRLLGDKGGQANGYLYFYGEYRNDMGTGIAPAALGSEIGSLWGTTNGFGEQPVVLKELYWQQQFGGDALIVRVGKMDPENYYNNNYWQSDSKFFLNKAFSSFPARSFPGQGLGFNVTARLGDQWYISAGAQDAQGKKTTTGAETFHDLNTFSAFELGYTPDIEGLGRGTYRITPWYRDAGETDGKPHDAGIDLSIDQHFGEHVVPFFRYGVGEGSINNVDQMVSGGVGWEGKLLSESDVIGVGGFWGEPHNGDLRCQYGGELFYRLQVSEDNQLTIGYQLFVDPSNQPNDDVVGVFEIRWRVSM